MKTEIWKDIEGYEGYYQVSNLGRVKRVSDGYILKPYHHEKGYLKIDLQIHGKRRKFRIHRIVAEAFIPNENNYPQINHINGMKEDNRVENLEWCTNKMNSEHAWRLGLYHRKRNKEIVN